MSIELSRLVYSTALLIKRCIKSNIIKSRHYSRFCKEHQKDLIDQLRSSQSNEITRNLLHALVKTLCVPKGVDLIQEYTDEVLPYLASDDVYINEVAWKICRNLIRKDPGCFTQFLYSEKAHPFFVNAMKDIQPVNALNVIRTFTLLISTTTQSDKVVSAQGGAGLIFMLSSTNERLVEFIKFMEETNFQPLISIKALQLMSKDEFIASRIYHIYVFKNVVEGRTGIAQIVRKIGLGSNQAQSSKRI